MTPSDLRASLERLGWSQAELARQAGCSAQAVTRWLSGERPMPEWIDGFLAPRIAIRELAQKLGVAE